MIVVFKKNYLRTDIEKDVCRLQVCRKLLTGFWKTFFPGTVRDDHTERNAQSMSKKINLHLKMFH